MTTTNIIESVINGDSISANLTLEKMLFLKAGVMVEELKKKTVAGLWKSNLKEYDEKSIMKRAKRNAFKEKMHKIKFGGEAK